MSDILRAPINYGVAADGKFVKGGSVVFGFENIRPDEANPATLKPIFLDAGLTLQAENPQGLSSDATFNQADNGVLFGETSAKYSIIIYSGNGKELSYIPSYDLSDSSASITAQDAANAAAALQQKHTILALFGWEETNRPPDRPPVSVAPCAKDRWGCGILLARIRATGKEKISRTAATKKTRNDPLKKHALRQ